MIKKESQIFIILLVTILFENAHAKTGKINLTEMNLYHNVALENPVVVNKRKLDEKLFSISSKKMQLPNNFNRFSKPTRNLLEINYDATTIATDVIPSFLRNNHHQNINSVYGLRINSEQPFSVVQDWSSVCKQLCGAALGGPACFGSQRCNEKSENEDVKVKAATLLKNKRNVICDNLCKYQLGGEMCSCKKNIGIDNFDISIMEFNRNQVCLTFCEHNDITISGCSLCTKIPQAIKTTTKITTTPEPDWDEICKSLCATGDGGSLCNCDKPPFF